MSNKTNLASDLRGLTGLITDATVHVTDLVEAVHQQIVHPPFFRSTAIQNLVTQIAGITYNNIRISAKLLGGGLDKALAGLSPLLGDVPSSNKTEIFRSVLNGVIGDHLQQASNPLEIQMQLKYQSKELKLDGTILTQTCNSVSNKVIIMVHGACMNDTQWTRKDHNHGDKLGQELDGTTLYLKYNSGRHISSNGQDFNATLEMLVQNWPAPIDELVIVGHSMGGLVARSAIYYAQQQGKSWVSSLKKVIFLGSPHHGAALERIGSYIDLILDTIPYTKPFGRLTKIRSSGVTDLRYGNLIDEDWQSANDRFEMLGDQRTCIPLPNDVECYSIAAVLGDGASNITARTLGDGLVDLRSALGQHRIESKHLKFKNENTFIVEQCSHNGLLSNLQVYDKIKEWLT